MDKDVGLGMDEFHSIKPKVNFMASQNNGSSGSWSEAAKLLGMVAASIAGLILIPKKPPGQ